MNATPSDAQAQVHAQVSHPLTIRARVSRDAVGNAFGQAPSLNGNLIFDNHGAAGTASPRKNPVFGRGGSVATRRRL